MLNFDTNLPAPAHVPNLSTSAMTVDLSIGSWSASKKDKRASADVAHQNHADAKMARAYKTLISSPKLDAIRTFVTRAHEINRSMTVDWAAGLRLCPTKILLDHQHRFSQLKTEFFRFVDDFGTDYNWLVVDMQARLGSLYNPDEYLPWDKLRQKFYFECNYMPVPDKGSFHLDVAAETEAHMRDHYERVHKRAMEQATRGLFERVHVMLVGDGQGDKGLIHALRVETDEATGKVSRGIVYDTRITAARQLVDMLGDLNITNDPKMNEIHRKLLLALDGVHTAADVKVSDTFREDLSSKLRDIVAEIPSLDDW